MLKDQARRVSTKSRAMNQVDGPNGGCIGHAIEKCYRLWSKYGEDGSAIVTTFEPLVICVVTMAEVIRVRHGTPVCVSYWPVVRNLLSVCVILFLNCNARNHGKRGWSSRNCRAMRAIVTSAEILMRAGPRLRSRCSRCFARCCNCCNTQRLHFAHSWSTNEGSLGRLPCRSPLGPVIVIDCSEPCLAGAHLPILHDHSGDSKTSVRRSDPRRISGAE